jgi:hypothetical protein
MPPSAHVNPQQIQSIEPITYKKSDPLTIHSASALPDAKADKKFGTFHKEVDASKSRSLASLEESFGKNFSFQDHPIGSPHMKKERSNPKARSPFSKSEDNSAFSSLSNLSTSEPSVSPVDFVLSHLKMFEQSEKRYVESLACLFHVRILKSFFDFL